MFHKYKAIRTELDGIKFPSKKEAAHYVLLKSLVKSGQVVFFLRQIPFDLPGPTKYTVDFQEFWADGTIRFVDVKGMKTTEFIRAKKQVEAIYPVTIETV
jgi:hypothetical protein